MKFYYDSNGIPFILDYNGTIYFYVTNLQGDVIGLATSEGMGGYYRYDAWGQIVTMDAASMPYYNALNANPLRYRGYIYDSETGFYYQQSRYYDPAVCRFINADGQINGGFLGKNLYAYCNNNPVNNLDFSGEFALSAVIIGTLVGMAIGFGATAYVDYKDDGEVFNDSVSTEGYVANTLVGGIVGGLTGGVGSSHFTLPIPDLRYLATTYGTTELVVVGTTTVTVSGVVVAGASILGVGIMFSKHEPVMDNKSPFSWTTTDEGIEAMKNNGMDARKATEDIMSNHFDEWKRGPGREHNAIHKWLDRVIRKKIKGGK